MCPGQPRGSGLPYQCPIKPRKPGWPGRIPEPIGLTLEEQAVLAQAPRLPPEKQWWNLPAKIAAGTRISDEESHKFAGRHNDGGDAMRHAEWSQRMATDIGPIFSGLAGLYHEG